MGMRFLTTQASGHLGNAMLVQGLVCSPATERGIVVQCRYPSTFFEPSDGFHQQLAVRGRVGCSLYFDNQLEGVLWRASLGDIGHVPFVLSRAFATIGRVRVIRGAQAVGPDLAARYGLYSAFCERELLLEDPLQHLVHRVVHIGEGELSQQSVHQFADGLQM